MLPCATMLSVVSYRFLMLCMYCVADVAEPGEAVVAEPNFTASLNADDKTGTKVDILSIFCRLIAVITSR